MAGEAVGEVDPLEHARGDRGEGVVRAEQEQLVLDADPERLAVAEGVLHHAARPALVAARAASAAIRPITSAPASPLA